jgi:hypothetical protein
MEMAKLLTKLVAFAEIHEAHELKKILLAAKIELDKLRLPRQVKP